MPSCLRRPFRAASLCLFLSGGALAPRAQTPFGATPPTVLDPFYVPGRATDLTGIATSASQGLVGAAELAARPFLRRGELLEVIPGVVITQHSGGGKANQYFLRGFNLDHGTDFALGVDGVPVNLRTHAHGQGYADLNFLIPELVREVDYRKGPYDPAVGDFSGAGGADFRLWDALPRPFLTLAAGSHGYARLAAGASVAAKAGAGTTTAALETTRDDGPWTLPDRLRRHNAFLRHAWRAGLGELRLSALLNCATWQATDQIPERAVTAGQLDRLGHVDPTNGGSTDRASVALSGRWSAGAATTRAAAYLVHYRLNLFSNFTYFLEDPVEGDQFNQRDRRFLAGADVGRSGGDAATGAWEYGLQARADHLPQVGLHRTAARQRLATVREDEVTQASLGVHFRHQRRWSPVVRTELGGRVDGFHFDVASDDPRNSGRAHAALASPKAGLVLGPWAGTELYLNAGTGFHSNDARGVTARVDPADGRSALEPASPLVRSRGAEVGVRRTTAGGLVSSLAVWGLALDSELVYIGDAGGTEPSGATRRFGLEWANFWRPRPWLALDADLALTQARYRDESAGGRRIPNSIGRVLTAGVAFGRETGAFGAVRLRHFGPQPLREDDSLRAPASTTWNIRAGWRARDWEVALEVLNATDRANLDIAYAYASRLPSEAPEGEDGLHFHPAEPRLFRLALTRRF
jgi:hypothetical protein